jgi:hypothetical protein
MKKRVIGFYLMLFGFAALLLFLQFLHFGSIVGFAAFNGDSEEISLTTVSSNEFEINILGYDKKDGNVKVTYNLKELAGKLQNLVVSYSIRNEENKLISEGKQEIFIEKQADKKYSLLIPLPKGVYGTFDLKLSVWNGRIVNEKEKEISILPGRIAGFATSEGAKEIFSNLSVFLISLIFISLTLKFFYRYRNTIESRPFEKRMDRGLIKIDLK